MALSSETSSVAYSVTAGAATFAVPFRFLSASDLVVTTIDDEVEVDLTLGTDYSVSGAGEASGGAVTVNAVLAVGSTLIIRRVVALTQPRAFPLGGRFPSGEAEAGLDHVMMAVQQTARDAERALRLAASDPSSLDPLPFAARRALKTLYFDETGAMVLASWPPVAVAADAVTVGTAVSVASLAMPSDRQYVRTTGFRIHGDGGDALYVRAASEPPHAGKLQSADGAWWGLEAADAVSPRWFGARGDGIADDTDAVAHAIAYAGRLGLPVRLPPGRYRITRPIVTERDLRLEGVGTSSIIDTTALVGIEVGITCRGALEVMPKIVSAYKGNSSVVFAAPPPVATGDVFCIYDPTPSSWSAARAYYCAGEWCEVLGKSSADQNTALITSPLYDGYNAARCGVYKLAGPRVHISNLHIIHGGSLGAITASLCNGVTIRNVTGYGEGYQLIELDRCYNVLWDGGRLYSKGAGESDYALVISNCQDVKISSASFYARRHGLALGGGDKTCSVSCRNVIVSGCTLKNDTSTGVYAADMHGNVENVHYTGCTIYGGAGLAGKDTSYSNCTIYSASGGWCVYGSEIKGGELSLLSCRFISHSDPSAISQAVLSFGSNSVSIGSFTDTPLHIRISDCLVRAPHLTAGSEIVSIVTYDCAVNVDITIDGLRGQEIPALSAILRTRVASGTGYSSGIVVDNISGFPSGSYLHLPAGGGFLSAPHKLMTQSGAVSLTATAGASSAIASDYVAYRHPYPRSPAVAVAVYGATPFLASGSRIVISAVYYLGADRLRVAVATGDSTAWTATTPVTVSWTATLAEV